MEIKFNNIIYILLIHFYNLIKLSFSIIIFTFIKLTFKFNKNRKIDFSKIRNNYNNYYNKNSFRYKTNYYKDVKKENVKFSFGLNVAICVIAKQENLYINEFVDYYKDLGIKKIFIYDNNEFSGENFKVILDEEISKGFVEIIDFRGINSPQIKAYNDCYINNRKSFDWLAFYDVDEFLYLRNYSNINEFLSLKKFEKCSSILINWMYYGDNNKILYEQKPLKNRFTQPFYFSNNKIYDKYYYSAAKSIIRGGLNISWAHFPHFLNNSIICRPDGKIVRQPFSSPQYNSAFIKHYTTKTIEEYIIKLFKGNVFSSEPLNLDSLIFLIKNYFFLFNQITKKKLKLIKQIIKIDIKKYL